ncbi:MAG TPA: type II toxin-antitoxin system HicB family antitoxin [Armatimonadota bacterium]|nr:type II toxin-antitoxin system HicB family antitoxin [Armatimonadota bacterium]
MEFEAFLEPAEEGGFVVTVPALPGCISEGDTREEALENIKDAITGYLETLRRRGDDIPAAGIMHLAQSGGSFDHVAEDSDVYSVRDLKVRYK